MQVLARGVKTYIVASVNAICYKIELYLQMYSYKEIWPFCTENI